MKVMKKPVVVQFERATVEQVVQTLEGPVTARVGDAIITGVKGERYPIQAPNFEAAYEFDEATGACWKKPIVVEAIQETAPFTVKVNWAQEPLQGKAGDYRLIYGPGDEGAVDAVIFAETYDILEA